MLPNWSINTAHNHYAMSFRAAIVQFANHTDLNTFRDNRDLDWIGSLELAQREYDRCNLSMLLIKNPFDQIVFVLWRTNRLRAQMRCAHCLLVSEQTVWISSLCEWNWRYFGKSRLVANISRRRYRFFSLEKLHFRANRVRPMRKAFSNHMKLLNWV